MPDYLAEHELRLAMRDCRVYGHAIEGFVCERCGSLVDITSIPEAEITASGPWVTKEQADA